MGLAPISPELFSPFWYRRLPQIYDNYCQKMLHTPGKRGAKHNDHVCFKWQLDNRHCHTVTLQMTQMRHQIANTNYYFNYYILKTTWHKNDQLCSFKNERIVLYKEEEEGGLNRPHIKLPIERDSKSYTRAVPTNLTKSAKKYLTKPAKNIYDKDWAMLLIKLNSNQCNLSTYQLTLLEWESLVRMWSVRL